MRASDGKWVKGESACPSSLWEKGQSGNPNGRPPREVERQYLETFKQACSPAQWFQIIARAVSDAIDGDSKARDWLSGYLVGKAPDIATDAAPQIQVIAPDEARSLADWFKAAGRVANDNGKGAAAAKKSNGAPK